jgi:hypothetical protein
MLRLIGGSDCWRERLWRLGFTRFEAAKEMLSGARSSKLVSVAAKTLFFSEPANPVKVLPWSAAAIKRAFPR